MSDGRIFVTRKIPDAGLQVLRDAGAEVEIGQEDEEAGLEKDEVVAGVKRADVLLSLLTESVDREVLEANPDLLGVANYAVGYNNIDVETATELGIPVTNTPGVLTDTTADLTWALLLAAARRVVEAHNYMVAGRYNLWGPNLFLGGDVSPGGSKSPKVLGIVGYGRIGQAVARRSVGFDMEVLAYDPYAKERIDGDEIADWAELDEVLERSDFVSLHSVLTDETFHLIGEEELRKMKDTAYLINVSRGPVIDEAALVRALDRGWIAGAGLDVFEEEPEMAPGLAECENAVLVPHIGSASIDTRNMMATMAATDAVAHLRHQRTPNCVNAEIYAGGVYVARAEG